MSPMLLLVISPEIPQEFSAGFLSQNLFYINCCMHTVDNPPGIQVGKDTLNTFKNLSELLLGISTRIFRKFIWIFHQKYFLGSPTGISSSVNYREVAYAI